jgi:NADPH:quinone reductase-like Zn-dependent oxidoreductase
MMIKAFKEKNIPVVAIVRKNEHVEELKSTYGL